MSIVVRCVSNCRNWRGMMCLLAALVAAPAHADIAFVVPAWAYPGNPPGAAASPPADDPTPLGVPGSTAKFTRAQLTDMFAPPDWHPDSHAPMPAIVAQGRKPAVYACGFCHLPDGSGRPENAPIAGLPADYIRQQVVAIRKGLRAGAPTGSHLPSEAMLSVAQQATDAEIASAAEYFSQQRLRRRVDVVEAARIPVVRESRWLYVVTSDTATEQLGQRLIEVAVDHERHELRDSATRYRAYVPPGSVERGRQLVNTGDDGRTVACAACHGADLRGTGQMPPLAGRSPSYLLRQLFAFRSGARAAPADLPMGAVVVRLEVQDMIAIAAYLATREP